MAYQRGSGFVGLQQYLGANQQAAQQLGNTVAGQIEGAQQGVRSAADTALAGVQQAAAAGTPVYSDPGDLATAQARASGGSTVYSGPQGLNLQPLEAQATEAGKKAQYGTTDQGVATLLQQQYGQGYTGVGGRSLDAALARRGAGERLDYAAGKGMDALRSYLGDAGMKAGEAVEQGRVNAANVRNQYAQYQPPTTFDNGPRRNVIQTPGTMPEKAPRVHNTPFDRFGRWLTGGNR